MNTDGSFYCKCYSGYRLDTQTNNTCSGLFINIYNYVIFCNLYTDIDECIEGTSGCDQICNNTVGSYNCRCMTGYQLSSDDHDCDDVNECTINNGGCEQICINTNGGHYCLCQEGFLLNNSNCTG